MKDLKIVIEEASRAAISVDPKCHATVDYDGSKVAEVCKRYNLSHEDTMEVYAAVENQSKQTHGKPCQGKLGGILSGRKDCRKCKES